MVWIGAGVSKFGKHFTNVVPPMVSNSPFDALEAAQAGALPQLPPRPAPVQVAGFMAHVGGTTVEIITPLVLLFSTNTRLTVAAAVRDGRVPPVHHLDVPARGAAGMERPLRLRRRLPVPRLPRLGRLGVGDMSSPWLTVAIAAALLFFPSWATSAPTWSRSCPRCGSTPATGPRPLGVRAGRGGRS